MAGKSAGRNQGSGEGTYELEGWVVGPQTDWVVALGLWLSAKLGNVHVPGVWLGGYCRLGDAAFSVVWRLAVHVGWLVGCG